MKFLIILVLISIKLCHSNDFECCYLDDKIESIEFYCENFNGTLPVNCTTAYLYSTGNLDKSKVKQLKIGGCDEDKINQIVKDFRNIHSLDLSGSNIRSLKPFDVKKPVVKCSTPIFLTQKLCRNENITFAFGLSKSTTKINLSHNNISSISHIDLISLTNLEYIDLSHNKLEKIEHDNIFQKAKNLKMLQLEDNRLESFDEKFLLLLKRGVTVHFSWKYVTHFEIKENIGKSIRIVLNSGKEGIWPSPNGNNIELHCSERSFDAIRLFKINDNHIENPDEILRCLTSSLGQLILIGEFTEKIHSKLLEPFDYLWELVINGAKLMEFDLNSIKRPSRLYSLDISMNNLKEIGGVSRLSIFPMIFYLNVAENRLENAPDLIHYFRGHNSRVYLTGNYVGKLNVTTFKNMDSYELYLKNTKLSFDDLTPFESFKRLLYLDISYNNLENANFTVPSTALKDLYYFSAAYCNIANASTLIELLGSPLRILDLSGNYIGVLNVTTFESFIHLRSLYLSQTNLIEIDFGIFRHAQYFDEANLSHNKLKGVNVTSAATYLSILYLDGNELTEIEPFTSSNFPKLSTLAISNNQIPCTTLAQLKINWPDLKLINNSFEQKHGDCSNVIRLINNLGFVGTFISKWF